MDFDGGLGTYQSDAGEWDSTTVADGKHTVEFEVMDNGPNSVTTTASIDMFIDNIVLSSVDITTPTAGNIIRNTEPVSAEPTPATEASYAELYVDDSFSGYDNTLAGAPLAYDFSLDTTAFSDGSHVVKVVVYDAQGSSVVDTVTVSIENKPSLYILDPDPDEVITGLFTVRISADDLDGIVDDATRPRFRVDGGTTWYPMSLVSGTYESDAPWNSTTVSDGPHLIEIEVVDVAGIITRGSVNVNVDNEYLTALSITSPISGATIGNTQDITVDPTPSSLASYAELYVDNVYTDRDNTLDVGEDFVFSLDTTGYTDGVHIIQIRAFDADGNMLVDSITVTIENTPSLYINKPTPNEIISGSYTINITADDLDGIVDDATRPRFRIDGGVTWYPMSLSSGTYYDSDAPWDSTSVFDGPHTIEFEVVDVSGNIVTSSMQIYVDNNAISPTTCIIVSPSSGEYVEGIYTFKAAAMDGTGLSAVEIDIASLGWMPMVFSSTSGFYEYVYDTTLLADGATTVSTQAFDIAGNLPASDGPVSFNVDNNAPVLSINSPNDGDMVNGSVTIDLTADEIFLDSIEYNVDGSAWVESTVAWDTTEVSEGAHTIYLRAKDLSGHTTETTIVAIVDNIHPDSLVMLLSLSEDQVIGGIFTLVVSIQDRDIVEYVTLSIDGGTTPVAHTMVYNRLSGNFDYILDSSLLSDGDYTIQVTAYNIFGGLYSTESLAFSIDNTAPTLDISSSGTEALITFKAVASDTSNIETVRINIDGTGWQEMIYDEAKSTYKYVWATTEENDGTHVYEIEATDTIGNTASMSGNVKVDNPDDILKILLYATPFVTLLLIIIVCILGLILYTKGYVTMMIRQSRERSFPLEEARKAKKEGKQQKKSDKEDKTEKFEDLSKESGDDEDILSSLTEESPSEEESSLEESTEEPTSLFEENENKEDL
jgi:hypothetical protein